MTQTPVAQTRLGSMVEQSIVAYIAPLVEGRRVAVVGPSSVAVAARVRALGAQSVVALGGEGEGVAVRPLSAGAIEGLRSRIDCVIVPDASAVGLRRALDESRRALGRDGLLVLGATAREGGPSFHRLRETLEERFGVVKMCGGGAFSGFALASLDDGADEVSLDTRMMPEVPESPSFFVAVASDSDFALDPFAIVQVPAVEVPVVAPTSIPADLARIEALEAALAQEKSEASAQRERAAGATAALEALQLREREGRQSLDRVAAELESARVELSSARVEAYRGRQRLAELERSVGGFEARAQELRAACEQAERDRDVGRREVARLRQEGHDREQTIERDVSRLERALGERGRECESLRRQVQERDGAVRELLFELDRARGDGESSELLALRARDAELASLHAAVGAEAARLASQNDVLRERVAALESVCESRDAELKQLGFQLEQARSQHGARARALEDARAREQHAADLAAERARCEERLTQLRAEHEVALSSLRAQGDAASALFGAEQAARAARARHEADEEAARLRAEAEAERRRAVDAEVALRRTLDRMTELEAAESEARARAASAETRLAEARQTAQSADASASALAAGRSAGDEHVGLLSAARAEIASLSASLQDEGERFRGLTAELERSRSEAVDLGRKLDFSIRAEQDLQAQLDEARAELSRQLALAASLDDRAEALRLELTGARRGASHRVRELELEVEQLVRALEVSNVHSAEEVDVGARARREAESLRAERDGLAMRLTDAEAALVALRAPAARGTDAEGAGAPGLAEVSVAGRDTAAGSERADQLLVTLADTAGRLASTEEQLASVRAELDAERARGEALRLAGSASGTLKGSSDELEALRRDSAEREQLARSLVAQLEDRDLRLRALERRLADEVDRARRTESEIWELELRARDQRLIELQRELDRVGGSRGGDGELSDLRATVASLQADHARSSASLDQVRSSLSSILIEGRGASVAHELVALLRQIERTDPR
jgi:chromosome segregation ATPase